MHYLTKALKQIQGVYYTPKKVTDKIQLDLLIGNPPYATKTILKHENKSKIRTSKKSTGVVPELVAPIGVQATFRLREGA